MRVARALTDTLADAGSSTFDVVLMPDFSVDHLFYWECAADAARALGRVEDARNVDVRVPRQVLRPGGGAANTAHALARLGARAHLVARTDRVGRALLEETLGRDGVDLSRVRGDGRLRATGALECRDASVMLETPEDAAAFGPERLEDADRALMDAADAVYVGHWPNPHAAELAATVWAHAKQHGACTTTDAGGSLHTTGQRERRRAALANPHLDTVSVNAEELVALAGTRGDPDDADAVHEAGAVLSERVTARVDVHTRPESLSFRDGRRVGRARVLDAAVRQATGAGDTWNAGLLLGDLMGLDADARLLFANAVVGLYLESEDARPPTLDDVRARLHDASGRPAEREEPRRP